MPLVLRTIKRNRWYKTDNTTWLKSSSIQADALRDLDTKGNVLSLWVIEDDESNLERVLTALAATGDHLDNIDYALVDMEVLDRLRISYKDDPGETPDIEANKYHINAIEITAYKLYQLARIIWNEQIKIERYNPTKLKRLLIEAIQEGLFSKDALKENISKKL